MTKIYITIIAVLAAMAVSGNGIAGQNDNEGHEQSGEHRGPGRRAGDPTMMIERMADRLQLDESQRQSIANIVSAARPEFAALHDASRENRAAIHALNVDDPDYGVALQNLSVTSGELAAELTLLSGRVRGEIADVLTPEQREVLADRMSGMAKKRGHNGRDRVQ